MTYEQAVEYIHGFCKFRKKPEFVGVKSLLTLLGNPQDNLRFVHISGTNGKGSIASMTANVLTKSGYRVGVFTSPYIVDFRERFVIGNTPISKEDLTQIVCRIKPLVETLVKRDIFVTEFEIVTAIGLLYFKQQDCDIVCLEVGIGGRHDTTNIISTPLVCCIGSISLDHTELLGDTVKDIAYEKSGIIKQGGTCVCYPCLDPDAMEVILKQAFLTNSTVIFPNQAGITILSSSLEGNTFIYHNKEYKTALIGEHQIYNAVTVIEVCNCLITKGFSISEEDIKVGIHTASWQGRLEIISTNPLLIIDGAHNTDGTRILAKEINRLNVKRRIVVIGMLKGKDYRQSLENIASVADIIICVPVDRPKRLPADTLLGAVPAGIERYSCADVIQGVAKARSLADKDDGIIVCGSLYLIGEFKQRLLTEQQDNA